MSSILVGLHLISYTLHILDKNLLIKDISSKDIPDVKRISIVIEIYSSVGRNITFTSDKIYNKKINTLIDNLRENIFPHLNLMN